MNKPRYTPLVASLPASVPFVGPETQERAQGAPFKARLGANENVFGPSPHAISAIAQAASDSWMYGDPENMDLRQALAAFHNVGLENIVVGEGIDGLLGYLVRLLVGEGDAVVTSDGAYPTFNYHVAGFGGKLATVPYKDDKEDPDALIAKAKEVQAKLIYIANPDNPMGSFHSGETLQNMIEAVPGGSLLILDEAYGEMAPASALPPIDASDTRVIRMRTFSKAYGLAGLRVGYAIAAPDLISAFNKVRNHFGVGRVAQAAALAALADQNHLATNLSHIAAARETIADIARDNGLMPLPSGTNFVTIDCKRDGTYARAVLSALVAQGLFVRMPFVAPQDRCIRISCGTKADLALLAKTLPLALAEANRI